MEKTPISMRKHIAIVGETNSGKSIGPIKMQANTKYEIFMKMEIKERLLINIIVN